MRRLIAKGFTFIELIVVILVLGTVSISVVSFIRFGVDIYQDGTGRERQIAESRYLIERMTRELREALPNSVRVSSDGRCVEFVPIVSSSSYIDIPVLPEPATNSIAIVAGTTLNAGAFSPSNMSMVVYPSNTQDVYADDLGITGKKFAVTQLSAIVSNKRSVTLINTVRFSDDSPSQRYFLVQTPVSYCQGSNNQVFRYQGYDYTSAFTQLNTPPNGVLMAQHQSNPSPFVILNATLVRNAVLQLNFEFTYNDEALMLYNEVHIVNVP